MNAAPPVPAVTRSPNINWPSRPFFYQLSTINYRPSLLVLAAGMGARYGGLKQLEPVGPGGETIIDYSIYDALRAGFGKIVFVIRREIEAAFRQNVGARFESRLPVEYVFQEIAGLPAGFTAPAMRKKPWGTGQAILAAAQCVREPFGVINADDFYGPNSLRLLAAHLQSAGEDFSMVGFVLRNTLSEFGAVARGVCRAGGGFLEQVTELTRIEKAGQGARYTDSTGQVHPLSGDEIVSLNLWGFTPGIFSHLDREFSAFLSKNLTDEKAEFYIPAVVNSLVSAGTAKVKVLTTPDNWLGVTYREDRPRVVEGIMALVKAGLYPDRLWA